MTRQHQEKKAEGQSPEQALGHQGAWPGRALAELKSNSSPTELRQGLQAQAQA